MSILLPDFFWVILRKTIPEEFTVQTRDSQQIKVTATATYAINPPNAPAIVANIGRSEESVNSTDVWQRQHEFIAFSQEIAIETTLSVNPADRSRLL
jgi:hypothetical protein